MERVKLLSDLNRRIASNEPNQAANTPFIFILIKKCITYNIPYALMERLNYTDLLALVIEYDIQTVKEYLRQKERDRLSKRGVEVQTLTPEQIATFFRKGG